MVSLTIPNSGEFCLEFDCNNIKRFSMCKCWYKEQETSIKLYEDYLYIFIEEMLGRIEKLPTLKQIEMSGKLGKWQEYFYIEIMGKYG